MLREYYRLTKPGIIYGNSITALGGFLFASQGRVDWALLPATIAGIALVIASACVYNNYLDREIDKKMVRTKQRALATGTISGRAALVYATILGTLGFTALALYTNTVTVVLGIIAMFAYIVAYGWSKRHSVHGTLVGSIAGALPITAGYTAVSSTVDGVAMVLFLVLVTWQMPHFYAIALYRSKEYAAAGLPVLPLVRGRRAAKIQIVGYVLAFIVATLLLNILGYTGYAYLLGILVLGLLWLRLVLRGFTASDDNKWARKVFGFSLLVLMGFSALISADAWLP